jgi:hypothetical protein
VIEMTNINDDKNIDRRRFITLAGVGGVGAVTLALPGQWTKPIFDLVTIPAHAQDTTNYLSDIFKVTTGPIDDGNESNDLNDQENESIDETESETDGGTDTTPEPTTSAGTTDPDTTEPPTTFYTPPTTGAGTTPTTTMGTTPSGSTTPS